MGSILYYEESGSGFPLILLHGNGESCEYFVHQVAHYEKFFHVIALDTRGQGKSPRGMTEYTINQFAEDVHEFMEEHQIAKAHVLGFSDGGNIAVTFALKYPQMVEKLILDGANIFPEGVEQDFLDRVEFAYARECRKAKEGPDEESRARAKAYAERLRLMIREPQIQPEELAVLTMPVLVIAGTEDIILEDHTKLIADSLPDGKLVWIKGDNFIARDNPDDFNAAVDEFLGIKK